ncbi:MAG: trimethylamine methyltransferase family protein [Acidobacteria bacterium]|jgi:trimethylamine--corrinoid protein Co-methyltransferase|nr:trimethylamine methyltransferase family protein [Acidobacteriota bacterium]
MSLRSPLRLLSDELIGRIVAEARDILDKLGTRVQNPLVLDLLAGNGARVDLGKSQAWYPGELIDRCLAAAPRSFKLYDVLGDETHDFSGSKVHFTPGSAALHILDHDSQTIRKPGTADYVRYVQLLCGLGNIAAQSTAFIPADVANQVSDSYRLFLSLLYGEKPVVTGTFTIDSFRLMRDMQLTVRGGERELRDKPLAVFSCCPTSPLKWSDVTSQNVVDCAAAGIPVEFISMPLSGFMAPVTLVGSLVQHTAETLSGIVISQCARPGAPMLYGGSPAAFDVRYETTPMGAVETQMIDCAANEIGKHLGLPTQAYIALSDAKLLDAQAGLETAMGATLAALSGINSISGPGMLDFESCQSLEKLVLDNEICGMALRLARGIEPREDFPALPLFAELLREGHLLIADHTRRHLKAEHYFPGRVIDRANLSRWREDGCLTLGQRAHNEVDRLVAAWRPSRLGGERKKDLIALMEKEARRWGMDKLPARPVEA